MPERIPENLRRLVAARASHRCEYCRSPKAFATGPFEVEHIVPLAKGGSNDFDNLAYSCDGCNGHKNARTAAKDLLTGVEVPLFHPRLDSWDEHFSWYKNNVHIAGKTPVGRVTVHLLRMNREELVNLRTLLALAGLHPF